MSATTVAVWLAIALTIAALVPAVFILAREVVRRMFMKAALGRLEAARKVLDGTSDAKAASAALTRAFDPLTVERAVEALLRDEAEARRAWGASLFRELALHAPYVKRLREAGTWNERMYAAEVLGRAAPPEAAPALVETLRDAYEDATVKRAAADALARIKDVAAVPLLVRELRTIDERSSRPVAEALVAFGEIAAPALLELVNESEFPTGRVWAARILGRIKAHAAVDVLMGLLHARDDLLRIAAAEALGEIGERHAVQALVQAALRDPAPQVRAHAAGAVAQIEPEGATDVLIAALADPDYATRIRALEAFENIQVKDTSALEGALRDPSADVRRRAALALERVGYVDRVVERLASDDPRAAEEAYARLLELGHAGLVDGVASFVRHDALQVRSWAARAAGELGATRAVPLLVAAASDKEWPVRAAIAEALGKLRDASAVPVLVKLLGDAEESVREAAAEALAAFPPNLIEPHQAVIVAAYDRWSVPVRLQMVALASRMAGDDMTTMLVRASTDPSAAVRLRAVTGLGGRDEKRSIAPLLARLDDGSLDVRMAAVTALGEAVSVEAYEGLLRALSGTTPVVRDRIAAALAQGGRSHIFQHIDELVKSADLDVRLGIAWTLGRAGDPRAVPYLADFLRAPEAALRASAAGALSKIAVPKAVDALLAAVDDRDAKARSAVVNALGKVAVGDARAHDAMVSRLSDPDPFVRNRAAVVLARISGAAAQDILMTDASAQRVEAPARMVALALVGTDAAIARAMDLAVTAGGLEAVRPFLAHEDAGVRAAFFEAMRIQDPDHAALEAADPAFVTQYAKVLRSNVDVASRAVAAEAVARVQTPLATEVLADALAFDPAARIRVRAARALAERSNEARASDALSRAITDPDVDIATVCIRGLTGNREPRILDALFRRIGAASEPVRVAVEEVLAATYKDDLLPFLDRMMGLDQPDILVACIGVLTRVGSQEIVPLVELFLRSAFANVRAAAVDAAAQVPGAQTAAMIDEALGDPSEAVRSAALRAIAASPDALMRLSRARLDPSPRVRAELAERLATFDMATASKMWTALLDDGSPRVRAAALASLLRRADPDALHRFAEAWSKAAVDVRFELRGYPGAPEITARLAAMLSTSHDEGARVAAIAGIGALAAPEYARHVLPSLQDPSPAVRVEAVRALAPIDDEAIRARIAELLADPDLAVREAVKRAGLRVVG